MSGPHIPPSPVRRAPWRARPRPARRTDIPTPGHQTHVGSDLDDRSDRRALWRRPRRSRPARRLSARFLVAAPLMAGVAVSVAGCSLLSAPAHQTTTLAGSGGVQTWAVTILGRVPHDPTGFVEGLALRDHGAQDSELVESDGLAAASTIDRIDAGTGAVLARRPVPGDVFAEGIADTPMVLWQLSWRDGIVFRRDPTTLAVTGQVPLAGAHNGEGWGACYNPDRHQVLTSDGSSHLVVRDPATFAVIGGLDVHNGPIPVAGLNSLDCTSPNLVWANEFPTDRLVGIDLVSGAVRVQVDLSGLRQQAGPQSVADVEAVPNGIAVIPGTTGASGATAWLAGKRWPSTFLVRLHPAETASATPATPTHTSPVPSSPPASSPATAVPVAAWSRSSGRRP